MTKSRIRSTIGVALAVLCVAGICIAPASAAGRYADPAGDSGNAPDITGVNVSNDSAGQITFRIAGTNLGEANGVTELDIDSDVNPNSGDMQSDGADYAFQVTPSKRLYGFWHWNGADWVDTPSNTVGVFGGSTSITISVNRSELGGTSEINFGASTFLDSSDGLDSLVDFDTAPADGLWNYSLRAQGPDVLSVLLATKPSSGARAGKRFVVTPTGLKLPPNGSLLAGEQKPESYTCAATIKGRHVAGSGVGGCTLRIPKKARGKMLNVTITVTYEGTTKAFPYGFKVR